MSKQDGSTPPKSASVQTRYTTSRSQCGPPGFHRLVERVERHFSLLAAFPTTRKKSASNAFRHRPINLMTPTFSSGKPAPLRLESTWAFWTERR